MPPIRHFDADLTDLKRTQILIWDLVEQILTLAVKAIREPGQDAWMQARNLDDQIDNLGGKVEVKCTELIALHAPMAKDLRFLISPTRIASDLEHISHLAEAIVKRATFIARHQGVVNPVHLYTLGDVVRLMTNQALETFVTGRLELATWIAREERHAHELTKRCYASIQECMEAQPDRIAEYTHLLRAVGHLEHIADLAVNVTGEAISISRGIPIRLQHVPIEIK